jgi:hypothetical protein
MSKYSLKVNPDISYGRSLLSCLTTLVVVVVVVKSILTNILSSCCCMIIIHEMKHRRCWHENANF